MLVVIFFLSMGNVFAEGNFTQLSGEINATTDIYQFTQDYVYSGDNITEGIVIEKDNYVVEGNDFTVDGQNLVRIFNISANNVTINNLNIINANFSIGGALWVNGSLILNNVTFINDYAEDGGAIYSLNTVLCNNVSFIDCNAYRGAAIFVSKSNLTVYDSYFTSGNFINFASIYAQSSDIEIQNTIFKDINSNYASAVYNSDGLTIIYNSRFINLTANETAGAIGIKSQKNSTIDSCEFVNVSSAKNGGAIFVDFKNYRTKGGCVQIQNVNFTNCSSDFGGAYLQLGGSLSIKNASFINNSANYNGGAIYTSYSKEQTIDNVSFIYNYAILNEDYPSNGGAIFLDAGNLNISNSNFKDNWANKGGAICVYDSSFNAQNCSFFNNEEAIHVIFQNDFIMEDCELNNDTVILNDTDYLYVVDKVGMELELFNNTINVTNLPIRFDSRDFGWISPIHNQGSMGSCWAFGMVATVESALLKACQIDMDISENNMQDSMLIYSKYGSRSYEGGIVNYAMAYLLSWFGVFSQDLDTYDELGKISPLILLDQNIHIQDVMLIRGNLSDPGNHEMKEAILKYGSIAGYYFATPKVSREMHYYNPDTYSQYCNISRISTHAISVVGWDDTFSADNFLITPPGDGAWIVKNSWGTDWGDSGYLYLSYYDLTFCAFPDLIEESAAAIIIENTIPYNKNYQYDLAGLTDFDVADENISCKNISYKNVFTAVDNDLIAAVGTYFNNSDVEYTIEIYVNGDLKLTQEGISPFYGYSTIKLNEYIPISKGDVFEAVVTSDAFPYLKLIRQHVENGSSFYFDGKEWEDVSAEGIVACLKVYTLPRKIITQDLVKIYKNDSKFVADVGAANESVIFEINDVNYTRISDENGTAKIAINLNPGNYTIKTTFGDTTVENNIEVLPTLIAQNLVKYFRNESQFYISLIDGEGNVVPNVNITMNINGVFYNRTTNENGTARLNINLNPGEYILTAIDPLTGLQMSYNITVLPVLTADDINMTYNDGTQFKAKLIDGEGNPLENIGITFNINGVFYTRYTNSSGIACLNINLMAGEYIITSQYESAVVSNKITISAKED